MGAAAPWAPVIGAVVGAVLQPSAPEPQPLPSPPAAVAAPDAPPLPVGEANNDPSAALDAQAAQQRDLKRRSLAETQGVTALNQASSSSSSSVKTLLGS
jgi:hypothetical protein